VGFFDKLLGRQPLQQQHGQQGRAPGSSGGSWSTSGAPAGGASEDERAVARYRYLLRTAPPESLEQVHAEAFARLTPEQRQQVLAELTEDAPQGEAPASAEPQDLARAATRAEMRHPGTLERTFGRGSFGGGAGMGMGGMMMGSMMGTIAGVVVGSAIANTLFDGYGDSPEATDAGEGGADAGGSDGADAGTEGGGDAGWGDGGGSDFGGSDFGGGDFGGGGF
jgi:hypothetical protein